MPSPTIPGLGVLIDELDKFLLELEQHDKEIKAGVASVGDAAAYSLVWELGNVRQTKEGPKTTKGYNLETGETVWLTIQRPYGYIRINENLYWEIYKQELSKVHFKGTTAPAITKELEACAVKVAEGIAKIISKNAPEDRGDLADSIEVVMPNDSLLDDADHALDMGE